LDRLFKLEKDEPQEEDREGSKGLAWSLFLLLERIAFAIVPVEVRYPDRIVGIALLL
jgi:hypothetical protein